MQKHQIGIALVGCVSAWLCGSASAQNLIANGSFESGPDPGSFIRLTSVDSSIDSWLVTSGDVDYVGTGWVAAEGSRSIDLDGSVVGAIAQDFATTPGSTYQVEFEMAGNPGGVPVIKPMQVSAASTATTFSFDTTGASPSSMGWQHKSWRFVARAGGTRLQFHSQTSPSGYGPAIDDVRVIECQNLVTNGSFEDGTDPGSFLRLSPGATDITGWNVTLGNIDYVGTSWVSANGARSIDLDGNLAGAISQEIETTPGTTYTVRFAMAGNSANGPVVKPMEVSAAGDSSTFFFDTSDTSPASMGWQQMTWQFVAMSTMTTLTFTSLDDEMLGWGPALDDVWVGECLPLPPVAVPGLSAEGLALLAGLLLVLGVCLARRLDPRVPDPGPGRS